MTGSESSKALLNDLTSVGFTDHEARLYVALVGLGRPATAYEIAKAASIPVANTYNVIRSLGNKGATKQVAEGPTRYVSVPPGDLFQALAAETTRRCEAILQRFEKLKPQQTQDYVELLSGQSEIERRIAALIEGAEQHIALKYQSEMSPAISKALSGAIRRGVRCMIIYYGEPPRLPKGKVYLWPHEGNGADLGKDIFTLVVDSQRAVAFDASTSEGTASENPIFVHIADVLLRHEIYLAEIMGKLALEVEGHFGPALYRLRERFATIPISAKTWAYVRMRHAEQGLAEPPPRKRRAAQG